MYLGLVFFTGSLHIPTGTGLQTHFVFLPLSLLLCHASCQLLVLDCSAEKYSLILNFAPTSWYINYESSLTVTSIPANFFCSNTCGHLFFLVFRIKTGNSFQNNRKLFLQMTRDWLLLQPLLKPCTITTSQFEGKWVAKQCDVFELAMPTTACGWSDNSKTLCSEVAHTNPTDSPVHFQLSKLY